VAISYTISRDVADTYAEPLAGPDSMVVGIK
jgi:hypothetical protein